jgi:hypothetical protein
MDYLGKGKKAQNLCTKFERNELFVCMEHFCDLLFQLMNDGTNTKHVVFIFFQYDIMYVTLVQPALSFSSQPHAMLHY